MKTFTDRTGRTWTIEITVSALKRVRDLAKVDLCQIGEAEAGQKPVESRLDDLAFLGEVLFAVVKPQADAQQVTLDAFLCALDGDAMGVAAEAFWSELACFFRPCLPMAGKLIALGAEIARQAREEREKIASAPASTCGSESTASQAPSEPTQAP
jgi:hypothetical protein